MSEAHAKTDPIEHDNIVDRVYDTLEHGANVIGTILGVDMGISSPPAPPTPIEHARRLESAPIQFRIIESIDAETGKPTVTLTNGSISRDCPSRAYAQEVLDTLRAKGVR